MGGSSAVKSSTLSVDAILLSCSRKRPQELLSNFKGSRVLRVLEALLWWLMLLGVEVDPENVNILDLQN